MRALAACLLGAAIMMFPQIAAAQTYSVPSGAFSIDYGAQGWATSQVEVDEALLVISSRTLPVYCILFSHPDTDVNFPGLPPVASQADINDRVRRRTVGRPQYTPVDTPAGITLSDSIAQDEHGFTRNFMFAVWEGGRADA